MKNTYRVTLVNAQNQLVAYRVLATSMAAAIAAAQERAGVPATTDPTSVQNEGAVDIEVV